MNGDNIVLCAASAYTKKYYINPDFDRLPESVQDELHIMCVLFTEDVGGILTLSFDKDGTLMFETSATDGDLLYDDIGSALKIKQLQDEKRELFESLETYFKVFYLESDMED